MVGTSLLNRYEILEKIGEGGMGVVYKAKCTLLNRFVAIKILKTELRDSEDFIARFKREANSIGSLSHPNIVSIYDVGVENNINFIVMEYINGETLKEIIKVNIKFAPLKALDIALQIAKALEYAHKNNIIHRDIKPDNILITKDNIVKLTDFGIAKVLDSVTITNFNKIIGSVHYFSPEQAQGKPVDFRTDIYALGVVMYEMVTGQVPFNGDTSISIAMMHIQEPVISPKEIISDIPENINTVILKSMEKEPNKRFQTVNEITDILNAIKENPDLEVNFVNKSIDSTTILINDSNTILSDTIIDSTVVINKETIPETVQLKKDTKKLSKNISTSKNKKIFLTIGLIVLAIIISILAKYLFKESSTDTDTKVIPAKTTVPEKSATLTPVEEKSLVPSLKGKTQDVAEKTIVNDGFLIGNITTEYSSAVPKGQIIDQSPSPGTYYKKNEKVDVVVSLGQKITQEEPQINGNGNGNGKNKEKDKKSKK
jgi:serine/threonine protein kinase